MFCNSKRFFYWSLFIFLLLVSTFLVNAIVYDPISHYEYEYEEVPTPQASKNYIYLPDPVFKCIKPYSFFRVPYFEEKYEELNFVITNEEDYQNLIKMQETLPHTCENYTLPKIDFSRYTLLAKPMVGSGCSGSASAKIIINDRRQEIIFETKQETRGPCRGLLFASMNWFLVKNQPGYDIVFVDGNKKSEIIKWLLFSLIVLIPIGVFFIFCYKNFNKKLLTSTIFTLIFYSVILFIVVQLFNSVNRLPIILTISCVAFLIWAHIKKKYENFFFLGITLPFLLGLLVLSLVSYYVPPPLSIILPLFFALLFIIFFIWFSILIFKYSYKENKNLFFISIIFLVQSFIIVPLAFYYNQKIPIFSVFFNGLFLLIYSFHSFYLYEKKNKLAIVTFLFPVFILFVSFVLLMLSFVEYY